MEKQALKANICIGKHQIKTQLEVYLFEDDGVQMAYCPALNLSAYGDTIEEAKSEFAIILREHIEWCIQHGTLEADLVQHGWRVEKKCYAAPLTTDMLIGNDTLRKIVNYKNYERLILPQMFNSPQYAYA